MYEDLIKSVRENACRFECGMCPKKKDWCVDLMAWAAVDVIEELSSLYDSLAKSFNEAVELLRKRDEKIVKLMAENARKPCWIPVEERLPDYKQSVLVFAKHVGIAVDYYNPFSANEWGYSDTTHWMPLPKPPEEGEQNEA